MKPFYEPLLAHSLLGSKVPTTDENIHRAMTSLRYPVWATLKMDGMRAVRLDGSLKSRTRKVIPNKKVVQRSLILQGGMDMELWNSSMEFNDISGICRTVDTTTEDSDKIQFHLLDRYMDGPYCTRIEHIEREMLLMPPYVFFQRPLEIYNAEDLLAYFLKCEREAGEGICFRTPLSPYTQKYPSENRSSITEQYLIKLTRFVYEEAVIVGFYEQMENANPEKRNAAGKMKRETHAENKFGKGMLGGYLVKQCVHSIMEGPKVREFKVPASHSDLLRREVWNNQDKYLGRTLRFKHKPHGKLNKPRSPIFDGFRDIGT